MTAKQTKFDIQQRYLDSKGFGVWEVTTEGDCEGRSVRQLGRYEGYLDQIALSLSDKAYYSLQFKLILPEEQILPTPIRSTAPVGFAFDTAIRTMSKAEQISFVSEMLADRPVVVRSGTYSPFELVSGKSPEEIERSEKEAKRAQALAKLSDEDRALLGL
jgi:hypothetical protein